MFRFLTKNLRTKALHFLRGAEDVIELFNLDQPANVFPATQVATDKYVFVCVKLAEILCSSIHRASMMERLCLRQFKHNVNFDQFDYLDTLI